MGAASLATVLERLKTGDPEIWPQIWVAKNYSKADLIRDLETISKGD